MSSTSRRLIYPAVVVVTAAAVGAYAASVGGRSSVAFLAGAVLAMGWVVWLAFRAAQALIKEPPATDAGAVVTGKRRKELEREKQALLKALKELDFDHQMGKVSDKDFAEISSTYRARAIRVMRQLDDAGKDYERMIEEDVKKRIGPSAVSHQPSAPDQCAKCSTKNDADAEFCKKCGSKIERAAS